jgi:hypothetical protein
MHGMSASSEGQPDSASRALPKRRRRLGFRALALLPLAAATLLTLVLLRTESAPVPRSEGPFADSAPVQGEGSAVAARALLIRACQALEESRWAEAQEAISQLRDLSSGRPEPLLLESLMAQRRQILTPDWGTAFLNAWTELGRPDLSKSPLLPPTPAPSADASVLIAQVWHHASAEARLILVLANAEPSAEQTRWLRQHATTLEDTALLVALLDPRRLSLYQRRSAPTSRTWCSSACDSVRPALRVQCCPA